MVTVTGTIKATTGDSSTGVSGAQMVTTWHFDTGDQSCPASGSPPTSDSTGTATCTLDVGTATVGHTVKIDVTFVYNANSYQANSVQFTPT
jgi:hypothetical protein